MLALFNQGSRMILRKVSEDATTITLGWDPIDVDGFRFSREKANGRYSHTWDGSRTSARFSKDSAWYSVDQLLASTSAIYPPPAPPPPPPPPSGKLWGFSATDGIPYDDPNRRRELSDARDMGCNCPRLTGHLFMGQIARQLGFKQWTAVFGTGKRMPAPGQTYITDYARAYPELMVEPENELNIGGSSYTPERWVQEHLAFTAWIRSQVPNKVVCSSVGNSMSDQGNLHPLLWCFRASEELRRLGKTFRDMADYSNFHMYGADPQGYDNWQHVFTPDSNDNSCQKYFGNPPCLVTEFGHPLSAAGSEAKQADAITAWMKWLKVQPNFAGGMVYTLDDSAPGVGSGYGMRRKDLSRRPAFAAFKAAAA